jgi:hypothetical protein
MPVLNNDQTLSFAGFSVAVGDLPEASIESLLALGFSTRLKNAIAGVKAGVLGTAKEPWTAEEIEAEAKAAGLVEWGANEATAEAIAKFYQRDMFEAILSGKAPTARSTTPRLSPDEKLRRDIAIEKLEAAAKAQGTKLPKRSKKEEREAFDAILDKALAKPKFADAVEKEFKARKKAAATEIEGLADIFE